MTQMSSTGYTCKNRSSVSFLYFSTMCNSLPSVLVLKRKYSKQANRLGIYIGVTNFEYLIRQSLYQHEYPMLTATTYPHCTCLTLLVVARFPCSTLPWHYFMLHLIHLESRECDGSIYTIHQSGEAMASVVTDCIFVTTNLTRHGMVLWTFYLPWYIHTFCVFSLWATTMREWVLTWGNGEPQSKDHCKRQVDSALGSARWPAIAGKLSLEVFPSKFSRT